MNITTYGARVRCINIDPVGGVKNGAVSLTKDKIYVVTHPGHNLDLAKWVSVIHDDGAIGVYRISRFGQAE